MGSPKKKRKPRILVIGEDKLDRALISEGFGDEVSCCDLAEGEDARAKLEAEYYDLITLDLDMASMNALDLLLWIRDDVRLHDRPVIVMFSKENVESARAAENLGASDYIVKPIRAKRFETQAREWLEQFVLEAIKAETCDTNPLPDITAADDEPSGRDYPKSWPSETIPCPTERALEADDEESFDGLTRNQLFLLSRIDGKTTVRELQLLVGLSNGDIAESLAAFMERDLIRIL